MSKAQKNREELIKSVTDDLLTSKFISEVGQKAKVERTEVKSEAMDQLRAVLKDIGENLLDIKAVPKGMTYCGSLSVHIYKSEVLRTFAAVTLSNHEQLTFDLADAGLRELTGTTMVQFGRSRQKLRSGF